MKKSFSFLVSTICIFGTGIAQFTAPAIQWQKTIGGSLYDELRSLRQTSDGGYILGGYSASNISGDKIEVSNGLEDYWVVKLDANGSIEWQNTIGGSGSDRLFDLQQTTDGGYILGGNSNSNISGDKTEPSINGSKDMWVLKLDNQGQIEWQKTIGNGGQEIISSVQQTLDGGYILGGTHENAAGNESFLVVKLTATGLVEWQKYIGGSADDWLNSIQQTVDGGYILGGYSWSGISGDKTEASKGEFDFWVVKVSATGEIQWQKTIGGNASDYILSLQQTSDLGYILGGFSNSNISGDKTENSRGSFDYWVVRLDALGNIQWQKTIGGNNIDIPESIHETTDGGYILGGYSSSGASGDKTQSGWGNDDFWVVKLNASGVLQWQKTIGGNGLDKLYELRQTADNGYILGGFSASNISGDKTENCYGQNDFWVLKLAPESVPTNDMSAGPKDLTIYPNPTSGSVLISKAGTTKLGLYNAIGQLLFTQSIEEQDVIDLSLYLSGIYFVVEMETGIGHKIIIDR